MGLQLGPLTVLLLVFLTTNAEVCVYKECDCIYGSISCDFKSLTKMPQVVNVSGAGRPLVLSYNNITEIPANSLPSNLSEIDLLNNPTTIIADTAFDGSVYTLETLTITFALFTRIPNAFGHLKALKFLTIQNVNVQDWNDDAMINGGQTLTLLSLDNVSLSSWPNWIQNLSQLTDLTIGHGFIQSIPEGAFDKFSNSLTSLNLASNLLTSIPKALSQLSALTSLNLQQNNVVDITWIPQRSPLSSLILDNNKLSDSSLFGKAINPMGNILNSIVINHNQLTSIPDLSFLTKVYNLDFSYNKISDPHSGSILPIIYSIDLSYNFLPAIPRFVSTLHNATTLYFPSNVITSFIGTDITPSAAFLDLGYNLITEITDNSFPNNSQLVAMHLNNNPIVTISNLAFTQLNFLSELYLGNTKLTRLPLALSSLTSLAWFDMTESVKLVCTCMEKSLEPWVRNLSPKKVSGTCGVLGIYDFFLKLSPDCPQQ
jgi:Leucine-rich repeat (LRR) protein